jgi:YbgC/YbaW family acyl-CoA thioester hydrolase
MITKIENIPNLLRYFKHISEGYVKFHEVDAFNVVHNLEYLYWSEIARVEYCKSINISILPDLRTNSEQHSIYLVHSEVNYFNPASFFDNYKVYSRVANLGTTSIAFEHIIMKEGGIPLCIHRAIEVYVNSNKEPVSINEEIREKIIAFEGESLNKC